MLKVGVFRHNLFVNSETFIRSQAASLSKYSPIFIARRALQNVPSDVQARSMRNSSSNLSDLTYGITSRSHTLTSIMKQEQLSVVHAHFGPDTLYAAHSARALDVPLVGTFHGRDVTVRRSELLRSKRPVAINYALRRHLLGKYSDLILCVSEEIRQDAIRLGIPEEKLVTHYIGIDTNKYLFNEQEREPIITHVARLVEKKGTSDLIAAFGSIARKNDHVRLQIIGDGPLHSELMEQANQTGFGSRIEFTGRCTPDKVRELVGKSQIFCLPSVTAENGDKEGLPISILEAMSMGTPVVSTRHSGIPEAINSPSVGILVDEHDRASLADSLHTLLNDYAAGRQIGLASAQRIRSTFNITKQSKLLEHYYDGLL